MVGPTYEISVDGVATPVQVAGGQITIGSVPWVWGDHAGLRLGADMFSTNLTPKGSPMEDGWGYRSGLLYASAFDRPAGWSASLGVYFRMRPATTVVGDELVFSRTPVESSSASGNEYFEVSTSGGGGKTTVVQSVQGFVHGTVPWINLTTGLLFDGSGIHKLKGTVDVLKADVWESIGPLFAVFPRLKNYQLGLQATRFRMWAAPITLSGEATMRYEESGGIAVDHALLSADLTLFEDDPDRVDDFRDERFSRDFHLRLELHGSYYNMPGVEQHWEWGAQLDALSIGFWLVDMRFGVGGGYNYYEDIAVLPIPMAANFQFLVGIGL